MKDKILAYLETHYQTFVSGQKIAQDLFTTRASVWKNINKLREEGYEIHASTNRGYKLINLDGKVARERILSILKPDLNVIALKSTHSTNDYAKDIKGPVLVVADHQTQGKGRYGKSFSSKKNQGIYMSLKYNPKNTQLLTLKAALAITFAMDDLYQIHLDIKWLNDLQIKGKKIGGILSEGSLELETMTYEYLIVGIGLNIEPQIFDSPLDSIATSLLNEFPKLVFDKDKFIATLVNNLYELDEVDDQMILKKYKERCVTLGTIIKDEYRALDINLKGDLICQHIHTKESKVFPYGIEN